MSDATRDEVGHQIDDVLDMMLVRERGGIINPVGVRLRLMDGIVGSLLDQLTEEKAMCDDLAEYARWLYRLVEEGRTLIDDAPLVAYDARRTVETADST